MSSVDEARALLVNATPAPWKIEDDTSIWATDSEGYFRSPHLADVLLVGRQLYRGEDYEDGRYDVRFPEAEANAALIAAAPRLLAALADEVDTTKALLQSAYDVLGPILDNPSNPCLPDCECILHAIEAAFPEFNAGATL